MKKIIITLGKICCSFAMVAATSSVNGKCLIILHQPRVPEELLAERKHLLGEREYENCDM